MKELYNYKEVFDAPITIRKLFNDYTLPFAVSMSRIVIILVTLLFLWLCRDLIASLNHLFSGASLLIYIGIPWVTSKYVMRIQPNGKKLHHFLWDFMPFFFTTFLPKQKYCHDEVVRYRQKAEFKSHNVSVRRKEHATESTD